MAKKKKPRKRKWVRSQLELFPIELFPSADKPGKRWADIAFQFLCKWSEGHPGEFLAEELRAEAKGVLPPHDARGWGSIFLKAYRAGVIRPAKTV